MLFRSALPDMTDLLSFALQLADTADAIALRHFEAQDFVVECKPDRSEVTVADRGTEEAIVTAIGARYPDHSIFGEEFGIQGGTSEWQWIIDPIDGTANYVRGVPVWATLIALRKSGVLQLGVVSAPALHRRWWASRGHGSYRNGVAIGVSKVLHVADAFISYSDGDWSDTEMRARLGELLDQCHRQRGLGDFWQHVLVAEGALDIAIEPVVSLWDLAAIQIVVEEAGGRFSDLDGVARPDGGNALSTNALLHDIVLTALHGA